VDRYNFKIVEEKWQKYWAQNKTFSTKVDKNKKKFYCLAQLQQQRASERARRGDAPEEDEDEDEDDDDYSSHTDDDVRVRHPCRVAVACRARIHSDPCAVLSVDGRQTARQSRVRRAPANRPCGDDVSRHDANEATESESTGVEPRLNLEGTRRDAASAASFFG
jgi:hypothetical protein